MFRMLFLVLIFNFGCFCSLTLAQSEGNLPPCDPIPEPEIFDVVGTVNDKEIKSRVEKFLENLKTAHSSQGYILNYGLAKDILQREKIIRESIAFRKYDASRLTVVRADAADIDLKTDLWIVPSGATPPTPKYSENEVRQDSNDSIRKFKTFKQNLTGCWYETKSVKLGKFDAYGEVSDRYFNWTLKEFVETLSLDKTLKGYILICGTNEEIQKSENRIRNSEILKNPFGEKIVFINGGAKKQSVTQLWILDEKSEPPKP